MQSKLYSFTASFMDFSMPSRTRRNLSFSGIMPLASMSLMASSSTAALLGATTSSRGMESSLSPCSLE